MRSFFIVVCFQIFALGCQLSPSGAGVVSNGAQNSRGGKTEPQQAADEVRESVDELLMKIRLPVRPSKARWKITPLGIVSDAPGPTDYKLLAEIEFDEKDLDFLADKLGAGKSEVWNVVSFKKNLTEEWFSSDFKRQMEAAFEDNEEISVVKYDLDNFTIPPFSDGSIIKIPGTRSYLLLLSAM